MLALVCASVAQANSERIALVIGNSSYKESPLVNPKNDAASMSNLLREAGFEVLSTVDATKEQMQEAVSRFGAKLREPQVKFALFYYAGHGVQQDWRNYLIPVNASVRTPEDIRQQSVDVTDVVGYMNNQQGKSFLVILDACRDDPFAAVYKPPAKGLSQFNAPVGSMLAFSTEPGKVALDGQGSNGLYTSFLLDELRVKTAKIEDVFKRVRLSVHAASHGVQTPWENTSLVDDVYLFPGQARSLSSAQLDDQLQKEIVAWNAIKASNDHLQIVQFIREYPSGSMSELAQARLARLLTQQASVDVGRLVQKSATLARAEAAYTEKLAALAREASAATQAREEAIKAEDMRIVAEAVAEKARQEEAQRAAAARVERLERERQQAARREALRLAQEREAAEKKAAELAAAAAVAATAQEQAQQAEQRLARERARQEVERVAALAQEAARQASEREAAQLQTERLAQEALARARDQAQRVALAQEIARRAQEQREATMRAEALRLAEVRELAQKTLAERLAAAKAEAAGGKIAANVVLASPEMALSATPFFTAVARHDRAYTVGDEFVRREIDGLSKAEKQLTRRVSKVDVALDQVEFNGGEFITDVMGNVLRNEVGSMGTPRQFYPADLSVGKRWQTSFIQNQSGGFRYTFRYDVRVVAKETITVPAGRFEAYKLQATGYNVQLNARIDRTIWVMPGINADIAEDYRVTLRNGQIDTLRRTELVSFKQAARASSVAAR